MSVLSADPRHYSPRLLAILGLFTLLLLGLSYFIEVHIIVTGRVHGDVTRPASLLWRAILGTTTIGSFGIAVYNTVTNTETSSEPARTVEIKGVGHDIHVYPGSVSQERRGGETVINVAQDEVERTSNERTKEQ